VKGIRKSSHSFAYICGRSRSVGSLTSPLSDRVTGPHPTPPFLAFRCAIYAKIYSLGIKQFEDVSVTRQLRDNQIQLPRGGKLEYILWLVNIVQR